MYICLLRFITRADIMMNDIISKMKTTKKQTQNLAVFTDVLKNRLFHNVFKNDKITKLNKRVGNIFALEKFYDMRSSGVCC